MKFTPFVLVTIMFGALVGWIAPDGSGGVPAPSAPIEDAAAELEIARTAAWNRGEVILPRAGDGHFYADVEVDGTTAHMLVDTGASVVALTGADARALGVTWDRQALQPVARGASGEVYGVRVRLARMQLGDFEVRGVEAIVVPEGLPVSLLGQSFLSQVPQVRIDRQAMVLGG